MLFLSGDLCQFSDLEGSSALSYHPCLLYSVTLSSGSRGNSKVARFPQEETTKFGQVEMGQKQRCVVFYLYILGISTFWVQPAPYRSVQVCRQKGWKLCMDAPNPSTA